jgi:hypothetical protein
LFDEGQLWDELLASLRLCVRLQSLEIYSKDHPVPLLDAAIDLPELKHLHYSGNGEEFRLRWNAPALASLTLKYVKLVPQGFESLLTLRVLALCSCTVPDGALPLGLESLTLNRRAPSYEELARVCGSLTEFTAFESLPEVSVFKMCKICPRLQTVRVSSLSKPDTSALSVVAMAFTNVSRSLRLVELQALNAEGVIVAVARV